MEQVIFGWFHVANSYLLRFSSPSSAFSLDDPLNPFLADLFGIAMGTSHEEPMSRSIPVEWNILGVGNWDYSTNEQFIYNFWVNSTERGKAYENVWTVGMRGNGDRTF